MPMQNSNVEEKKKLIEIASTDDLLLYPVASSLLLTSLHSSPGFARIAGQLHLTTSRPALIMHSALAMWERYLATRDELHRQAFIACACWLVAHETSSGEDAGRWPFAFSHPDVYNEGPWLSALTQGTGISVLVRAYQLTREDVFLEVARRAVRSFELDILDGGVSAAVGTDDIFFEEVAAYPASHGLAGFIFALFGLYDYVALIGDIRVERLIARALVTMHLLLKEYDTGYWTHSDLLHRQLASSTHLALLAELLEALSTYVGCEHCMQLARRWKSYQRSFWSRLRYFVSSRSAACRGALLRYVRAAFFPRANTGAFRVCIPITGFPVTGGTRTVLAHLATTMKDRWQIEYLTQHIGSGTEGLVITRFGATFMSPWQFPFVWLYALAGFCKLTSLMHHGANYRAIIPQDGVFTAAFSGLVAKLVGVRTVCIDHGNLTLLESHIYRVERIRALAAKNRFRRLLERLLFIAYWPSLSMLVCLAARSVDHFLVPGVEGDGVETICERLGIPRSRITRFASMIEVDKYPVLDRATKSALREKNGIPADALVVALVCRLSPEKGIDVALEAIKRALAELSSTVRERVRVVIAGGGPLAEQVKENVNRNALGQMCLLWGSVPSDAVSSLLSMSDIFLYTSVRGACLSMAVLEAMAAGCAVVASTLPMSNEYMLAEGRGIAVPSGDAIETSKALVRLLNDPDLCRHMGQLARNYVAVQHSPAVFRRVLQRVIGRLESDRVLNAASGEKDDQEVSVEK